MELQIEKLKEQARESSSGQHGEQRADELERFVRKMLAEYTSVMGGDQGELLSALEAKRTYSAISYYQEANLPSLAGVRIFDNLQDLFKQYPSKQYRCPACKGVSSNPYDCNSGIQSKSNKPCDWKAYGLFRTLGEGLRFTFREGFQENPRIEEIFMPIEAEKEPLPD
ncbi:hypothetical protein R6242_16365 [Iodobacter sp. CM08]|uniref:hypothetical protein n=1 Tax=Iodobacter sp. CM08 TaxID=3085902 RepID=UPI0029824BB7|nr:hypothetical protein [Iodobacter sp. CM08]MDW5418141.1 hypothetical protein [Iodobacter sp. CM08]